MYLLGLKHHWDNIAVPVGVCVIYFQFCAVGWPAGSLWAQFNRAFLIASWRMLAYCPRRTGFANVFIRTHCTFVYKIVVAA